MAHLQITCSRCKKKLLRRSGWVNENKKLNYKHYCSPKCLGESKKLRRILVCENPRCKKKFERKIKDIAAHNYCSRSCAVTINNTKYPKNPGIIKKCRICGKDFVSRKIYCSLKCLHKSQIIEEKELLRLIRNFYERNGRIPLKREFVHYHAARGRFGTWNNAIKVAGFEPNPVMFAKKHEAKDGHICDSLAEKIIDDWFFRRGIKHEINVPYPGNHGLTADFVVGEYWIEFFGLNGEHKRYDELKEKKLRLVKGHELKLIEIYPKHLFPKGKLDEILGFLVS